MITIKFPSCSVIDCDQFTSKKGTRCGVLRWFDTTSSTIYRVMCFGDDVEMLTGHGAGELCSISLDVVPSRRDDSIELRLAGVETVGA